METVIVQINNHYAFDFLKNLEALNVIKVLSRQSERMMPAIDTFSDRSARILEIRSITENAHIDLTNFCFNRDEANNYDE